MFLLDQAVWSKAQEILTNLETIPRQLERLQATYPTEGELSAIDAALRSLDKRQAVLTQSISMVPDVEAAAPLIPHLKELGNQERTLMQERAVLREQHQSWHAHRIQLSSLEAWCQTVRTNLHAFDFKQWRMVLGAPGFSAKLYRSDHEPRYVIAASIDEQLVSPTTCDLSPRSGCGQSDHSAATASRCFSGIAGSNRARPDP